MLPPAHAVDVDILRDVCHAFGSTWSHDEATEATLRWVRVILGTDLVATRLALPDRAGRLRAVAADGEPFDQGRLGSARRWEAFTEKRPATMDVRGRPGTSQTFLPLVCRGEAIGVLEIVAPRTAVARRLEVLEAVASQAAMVFRNIRRGADLERALTGIGEVDRLAQDLLRSTSPGDAVKRAVRFCWRHFGVPVAAWSGTGPSGSPSLVAARGIGALARDELAAPPISALGAPLDRDAAVAWFADVLGARDVGLVDAGDALVLVGGTPAPVGEVLNLIGSILREVLDRLAVVASAERRNDSLDSGLAWTAHEIRSPLLGVEKAMEVLLSRDSVAQDDRRLLGLARDDLRRLAETVDGLLRWSVGVRSIRRRPTDMARLLREIAESCSLEAGVERIEVRASSPVTASVDATLLRGAIENIVRNALAYADPDGKVEVSLARANGSDTVTIRDDGPGIPPEEREAIFDPFVRGRGSGRSRTGGGLGLFIARRVVQAHGGVIRLESGDRGAAFHVDLPVGAR